MSLQMTTPSSRGQLRIYLQNRKRSDEYATPQWLFDDYHNLCHFDIDVAASDRKHKVNRYFTRHTDALKRRWFGRVWCNPPYSNIYPWVKKAHEESLMGATVVMLLPCWIAPWFHELVLPYAHHEFLKDRLKFDRPGGTTKFTAYFDSMIVVFPRERAISHGQ